MTINKSKSYTTREGKPVRIYCTDAGGKYPIHGAILCTDDNTWEGETWTENGLYNYNEDQTSHDLVELKIDDKFACTRPYGYAWDEEKLDDLREGVLIAVLGGESYPTEYIVATESFEPDDSEPVLTEAYTYAHFSLEKPSWAG